MEPIRVLVRRGGVTEARHVVHAVAVRGGTVVVEAGDGDLVTLMRSAAKPLQALPLVRAVPDLSVEEIAIASASHLARPEQIAPIRRLLARAGASEADLECGPVNGSRLNHNCSGKHAGMLLLARVHGWQTAGYRLAEHPVQQAASAELVQAAGLAEEEIATAVDGCGVVTFGLPLERMALAFARLPELAGGGRVGEAMRARPELVRGPDAPDVMLMRTLDGWTAKGGAEGVLCATDGAGLGLALKVEDGDPRALKPALAAFLAELDRDLDGFHRVPVLNSRGEECGEMVAQK